MFLYFKAFNIDSCCVHMKQGLNNYRRWISTSFLRYYYQPKNLPLKQSLCSYGKFFILRIPIKVPSSLECKKARYSRVRNKTL
jgi:hypothetical protein